jgi:hypothetical protein
MAYITSENKIMIDEHYISREIMNGTKYILLCVCPIVSSTPCALVTLQVMNYAN